MTNRPIGTALRRVEPVPGLVSIVVPAHNAGEWVAETLASAMAQSYRDVEIIVVDDGSSDATAQVAESLGATVVRARGAGPGGARNAGMAAARGEFLQFLDADDLLAPEKIERQVTVLDTADGDVAWESFDYLVQHAPNAPFVPGERVAPEIGADLAASLLSARGFVQIGAMLIRRSAHTDAVWFPTTRGAVEDIRYVVELALAGARFVSSDVGRPGLLYRQHAGPRYSTRPVVSFARGCADNAAWAQRYWEEHGGLTAPRRAALADAYAFAARQLAAHDRAAFDDVAARGLALGPDFTRRLPARVRLLSRIVGYHRAEMLATRWRRLRRADRSLRADA
jgi:hypothetical protein